jgi:hypothetical protein
MRKILLAAVACILSQAAIAAGPSGIFEIYHPGEADGPAAAGVTIDVPWSMLESNNGTFTWTYIDDAMAVAGTRPVKLGVEAGVFAPPWIYSIGARPMAITWGWNFAFPLCSTQRFPLPWDTIYLTAWNKFVAAFAARYANNPRVVAVDVSGQSAKDLENVFPVAATAGCGKPIDPQKLWLLSGYTPNLMQSSYASVLQAFVAGFPPPMVLVMETGGWAFPGIDDAGHATAKVDEKLVVALMQQFVTATAGRGIIQNNALTAVAWTFHSPIPGVPTAYQAGAPITGDPTCRDNGFVTPCNPVTELQTMLAKAKQFAAPYEEFYPPDINSPALAAVFK